MTLLQTPPTAANDSIAAEIIPNFKSISSLSLDELIEQSISNVTEFAISLAIAIAVFYIGKFIIKKISLQKSMHWLIGFLHRISNVQLWKRFVFTTVKLGNQLKFLMYQV